MELYQAKTLTFITSGNIVRESQRVVSCWRESYLAGNDSLTAVLPVWIYTYLVQQDECSNDKIEGSYELV